MAVIDRRIGLLFLVFVGLLGVAVLRATYLGAVRGGSLRRVAATQQVTNIPLPANRGALTDQAMLSDFAIYSPRASISSGDAICSGHGAYKRPNTRWRSTASC